MQVRKAAKDQSSSEQKKEHAVLLKVARLMAGDPRMKPTAALRSCGITLDADLRRLRARFNAQAGELASEARAKAKARSGARIEVKNRAKPARKSAAKSGASRPRAGDWPRAMSASGAVAVHMTPEETRPSRSVALDASRFVKVGWPGDYLRNGLSGTNGAFGMMLPMMSQMVGRASNLTAAMMAPQAIGTAMERQLELCLLMARCSPLNAMLQGQAMMADMMLGMMRPASNAVAAMPNGR